MTSLILAVQGAAAALSLMALARVGAAHATHARRAAVLRAVEERVHRLDSQVLLRLREVVADRRRAAGDAIPSVHFADLDLRVPLAFDTDTVFAAGRSVGARIATTCDGEGACGLCVIRVTAGLERLDPPGNRERALLGPQAERDPGYRLACRVRPHGDITVACVYG